jgi:hypothetical protein
MTSKAVGRGGRGRGRRAGRAEIEIDQLGHLLPDRPNPDTLVSSIKALGLRLSGITEPAGTPEAEPGSPMNARGSLDEQGRAVRARGTAVVRTRKPG